MSKTNERNNLVKRALLIIALVFGWPALGPRAQDKIPGMVLLPGGTFEMGDHHGFVDPRHGSDETPIHKVRLDSFYTNANGYGLYDMAGNVWQFVNDWYGRDYYAHSPADNPPGPIQGSPMPDGKAYRGMRGGNWYNGENGHSRVSNRNPSYYRGPQDPEHPYYHVGFRVVLPVPAGRGMGFVLRSPEVADGGMLPKD